MNIELAEVVARAIADDALKLAADGAQEAITLGPMCYEYCVVF